MALRFLESESNEIARLLTLANQMHSEGADGTDARRERRS
jgi:hypothetical protein